MKHLARLIAGCLLATVLSWAALAYLPAGGAGLGAPASGGGSFSLDWTAFADDTAGGTTVNYGTLSIGAADANRVVAVAIVVRGAATGTISSVSIGGSGATRVTGAAGTSSATFSSDTFYLAVPSGTTASVSVTYSASSTRSSVNVYRVVTTTPTPSQGVGSSVSAGASPGTLTAALTVPSGGAALVAYGMQSPTNANDITWSNATKDHTSIQVGTFSTIGSAKATASATVSASIASSAVTNEAITAAVWGP